jgi:hypothetical protein
MNSATAMEMTGHAVMEDLSKCVAPSGTNRSQKPCLRRNLCKSQLFRVIDSEPIVTVKPPTAIISHRQRRSGSGTRPRTTARDGDALQGDTPIGELSMMTVVLSTLGTLVVVVLVLNFRTPEKEAHHRVKRLYDIKSPQGLAGEGCGDRSYSHPVLALSERRSPAVEQRAKEVQVSFVCLGQATKTHAYEDCMRRPGVTEEEIAYLGDDLRTRGAPALAASRPPNWHATRERLC